MPNEAKKKLVTELKEKFARAKAFFFLDYKGINANKVSKLRTELSKSDAEIEVAKNTLIKIALGDKLKEVLIGPTAILFAFKDPIEALKPVHKLIKEIELPKLKIGFLGEKLLTASDILQLATLPGKEVLQARLVSQLMSPIYRFYGSLRANEQKLVFVLKAVTDKRV